MHNMHAGACGRPEGTGSPETGVTGGYEMSDMSVGTKLMAKCS